MRTGCPAAEGHCSHRYPTPDARGGRPLPPSRRRNYRDCGLASICPHAGAETGLPAIIWWDREYRRALSPDLLQAEVVAPIHIPGRLPPSMASQRSRRWKSGSFPAIFWASSQTSECTPSKGFQWNLTKVDLSFSFSPVGTYARRSRPSSGNSGEWRDRS